MIGKIVTGKSFRGCLQYCLHDKISEEQNNELVMKDRAEVIWHNQCFGTDKELIQQFNEVRQLNTKLSKPVLHITLSLSKGENLPGHKWVEITEECARDLGFNNNQFVAVLHKDTTHPHIVANRIGYHGKTVSDSNSYQKIAKRCRKLEVKHQLKQVLSPNAFLPKELRDYERLDERKEQLKAHIKQSIVGSKNYEEFEQKMKDLKYKVIKMRGIAFRYQQKVYTKSREVGYSLATIEKILSPKQGLKVGPIWEILQHKPAFEKHEERSIQAERTPAQNNNKQIIINFLKPESAPVEVINQALMSEQRKRRKKQKHRHL